ncbi:MAG: class I SAM-dependent methyltransferase [Trueperaceae bacterium]|nr:class I SAM-dependent methyltransferase [Trueperaceae bacterium]
MAQNIYDNADFFAGYSQFARSREGLAGAPEWPSLKAMLPDLTGARVLDLGCGFGHFSRWATEAGASKVTGVDLSERMLEQAESLTTDSRISYQRGDLSLLEFPQESFDLVYSSLAFHYLPDCLTVFKAIRERLIPGGHFVFSVEHPLFTAPLNPHWQTEEDGTVSWALNNYLVEGKRVTNWVSSGVVKYHRSLETYLKCLLENGFSLNHLIEWRPNASQLQEHPEWTSELHRPMFLLLGAVASSEGS